jgi:GTP-binding protein
LIKSYLKLTRRNKLSRFIDEVDINVRSGNGGPGAISFRREKYVPKGGPDGGDGGNGGNIIIMVKKEMRSLYNVKSKKTFRASNGMPGMGKNKKGAKGEDRVIYVPPGTVILEKESKYIIEDLTPENNEVTLLKGGKGGFGNAHFTTSINRAPRYAQKGTQGSESFVTLQLKTIADIGIVGLPNAGKSTLLSVLTGANPRVGNYPFTTLTPNLGVMNYKDDKQFVLADVPGLIEGASKGLGLGIQFLKHIERTKIILILLDLFQKDFESQYMALLNEMGSYSTSLLEKPKLIVGSKKDIISGEETNDFFSWKIGAEKICVSSVTGEGLDDLKDKIVFRMEQLDEK